MPTPVISRQRAFQDGLIDIGMFASSEGEGSGHWTKSAGEV